ncbi:indole-3-glycerol phosphate synthase TrpC [Acetobacter tropicalis]|uniref:Indole-3-glycerol phosphate synthase n=2 Tax=Acetobacter tropicalis TaxID=104102 RepID=A0A095AXB9_9PROT|nr:indole-3-glycerol phosphate synthase TrpC [Acetobacter tropicalis]KAA8389586.1 indole-3-glycerol phosphate synthase TrpC [Acetobacter tropicalis]KAA8390492.1 indole-3-glycerol phosphate synthase TrpC [Acetobacter tropicalis]KGB21393.1 Indole-3-glycerol phosphate synthase [Acetobacter tropicalis]KXV55400.1 indole-3-glycerol phosphate synthase [Acetobacter tropicalis]MBC9008483.1 indole-3-glycerol phosphate synthase TrpC [Acetobacter tropicalis]
MNEIPNSAANAVTDAEACIKAEEQPDVLSRIVARTRVEVEHRSTLLPLKEIIARAQESKDAPRGFGRALKEKAADRTIGLIAEIKKASPSAGILREEYDPARIAASYEQAGAACLSVLTESSCFHGQNEDLQIARAACSLPVLRKDFILDPWQVYESRMLGADCILLIMSILKDEEALALVDHAKGLDMDVLVEVHDEDELNRALALDTFLIGINNRNLKTLETNIQTTCELAPLVPPDRIIVSESGIKTHADVMKLAEIGATGFLVGESLLRTPDPGKAARALLGFA